MQNTYNIYRMKPIYLPLLERKMTAMGLHQQKTAVSGKCNKGKAKKKVFWEDHGGEGRLGTLAILSGNLYNTRRFLHIVTGSSQRSWSVIWK